MKGKILSCMAAIMFLGSLFAGCNGNSSSDEIKIGMLGPMTGQVATFGVSAKQGAELAVKEINDAGGINGKKVKLIVQDDEADQTKAVNAFNTLCDNDKVCCILGPITSGNALAVAPNSTQNGIPMLSPSATAPNVTSVGGEYTFRTCFIDYFQGAKMSEFAIKDLKSKTASVLYNIGSDYSKGIAEAFKEYYTKMGGTIKNFITYNDNDKDFSAQLTKIKNNEADVLFLPDYYNVVGLIAKQAKETGIKSTLLGVEAWESDDLTKIGGDSLNGSYYLNHYYPGDTNEVVKKFVDGYKKEFSKIPDSMAALGYDGCKALMQAIKKAGSTDGDKIKEKLKETDLNGVTGHISFNKDRNAIKEGVMIKIEKDNKILYKRVDSKY